MAGLWAGVAVVVIVGRFLFGAQNVQFSYSRLLHSAVPGVTNNMWFNFDLSAANLADQLPFRVDLLGRSSSGPGRAIRGVRHAPLAILYWTFNLLAIVAVFTLWRDAVDPTVGA